jgi:hypothetical protein
MKLGGNVVAFEIKEELKQDEKLLDKIKYVRYHQTWEIPEPLLHIQHLQHTVNYLLTKDWL